MALEPNFEEQALLAATARRRHARLSARESTGELAIAVGFVVVALSLVALRPPGSVEVEPMVICTAVLAFAMLVRFETPLGFTVPTQVAFVPVLFAMPVTLVPWATVVASALAECVVIVRERKHPSRALVSVGNAWFALGPVLVFALADVQPARASVVLLVVALGAQFAVDFAASTVRQALTRNVPLSLQLGDAWVYGVDAALSGIGLVVARDLPETPWAAAALVPLLGLLAIFARERSQRLRNLLDLNRAYRGMALVLGDVVEADDGYTGQHCQEVVRLALALGARLGLGAAQMRNLEFGALLHDVGKIAIPKSIINKPSALDEEEWAIVRTHTIEGQRMLDRVGGFMREVGVIVRAHHERWDGAGYPDGIAGDAIPLEARIIACCDTWNAMRTDRAYRRALRQEDALAEILAIAGSQLDPVLAADLIEIVASQPHGDDAVDDAADAADAAADVAAPLVPVTR